MPMATSKAMIVVTAKRCTVLNLNISVVLSDIVSGRLATRVSVGVLGRNSLTDDVNGLLKLNDAKWQRPCLRHA